MNLFRLFIGGYMVVCSFRGQAMGDLPRIVSAKETAKAQQAGGELQPGQCKFNRVKNTYEIVSENGTMQHLDLQKAKENKNCLRFTDTATVQAIEKAYKDREEERMAINTQHKFKRDTSIPALGKAYRDPSGLIWGEVIKGKDGKLVLMNFENAERHCQMIKARLPAENEANRLFSYLGKYSKEGYSPYMNNNKETVLPELLQNVVTSDGKYLDGERGHVEDLRYYGYNRGREVLGPVRCVKEVGEPSACHLTEQQAAVGTTCITKKAAKFKRYQSSSGALGWQDMGVGGKVWFDDMKTNVKQKEAEDFCKGKGLTLPTGLPAHYSHNRGTFSDLALGYERGYREILKDTHGLQLRSSTSYGSHYYYASGDNVRYFTDADIYPADYSYAGVVARCVGEP